VNLSALPVEAIDALRKVLKGATLVDAEAAIGPLDRFFKAGGELVYSVPARVDGDGTYAQIRLPMGVTAEMVAAKRARWVRCGIRLPGAAERV
jgi:hypothetical protein